MQQADVDAAVRMLGAMLRLKQGVCEVFRVQTEYEWEAVDCCRRIAEGLRAEADIGDLVFYDDEVGPRTVWSPVWSFRCGFRRKGGGVPAKL